MAVWPRSGSFILGKKLAHTLYSCQERFILDDLDIPVHCDCTYCLRSDKNKLAATRIFRSFNLGSFSELSRRGCVETITSILMLTSLLTVSMNTSLYQLAIASIQDWALRTIHLDSESEYP